MGINQPLNFESHVRKLSSKAHHFERSPEWAASRVLCVDSGPQFTTVVEFI